jgi:hypothetical protein
MVQSGFSAVTQNMKVHGGKTQGQRVLPAEINRSKPVIFNAAVKITSVDA